MNISNNLGAYLAGLIEGDGTIYVPSFDKQINSFKKNSPSINIVFNEKDYPLAEKIQSIIGGNINKYPKQKYLIIKVQDFYHINKIVKLINGKMRSPKIEALKRLID